MMAFSQARSANAVPAVPPAVPAMHAHAQLPVADPAATLEDRLRRKRKADTQDTNNERLNKRMSLLNLKHNGPKLYVPVEQAQAQAHVPPPPSQPFLPVPVPEEEPMHLDDTKHKVYIYNLDDELSDSESESASPLQGRLVFLPDIEKHLRANRIPVPRPILPNRDGQLAGMQMVLYQPDGPKSISVPEEQDSVRRAIVAARARVREKQALERSGGAAASTSAMGTGAANGHATRTGTVSFATPVKFPPPIASEDEGMLLDDQSTGQPSSSTAGFGSDVDVGYDPDAMDID